MRLEDQEHNLLALELGRGVLSHQPAPPTSGWGRINITTSHTHIETVSQTTSRFQITHLAPTTLAVNEANI